MQHIRNAVQQFLKTQPPARIIAIGFALLIAAASADNAELLGGRATLFVAAVGVLAMWTGTARNA